MARELDKQVGTVEPRWRTEVHARGSYVVLEQEDPHSEKDDVVNFHVDSIDEVVALLIKARDAIRK